MKLKDFTKQLLALENQHGECQVFVRDSRSGDCSALYGARVTNVVDDQGPFDLADGEFYISITADH